MILDSLKNKAQYASLHPRFQQVIERTDHCIGINLHRGGILADGRDALTGLVLALQNLVANAVGYLQIDGFAFLEIHNSRNLG